MRVRDGRTRHFLPFLHSGARGGWVARGAPWHCGPKSDAPLRPLGWRSRTKRMSGVCGGCDGRHHIGNDRTVEM